MTHANFSNADLRHTLLISLTATDADFSGANLSGANLSGANLSGANLTGAVSNGSKGTPTSLPSGWTSVNGTLVPPS